MTDDEVLRLIKVLCPSLDVNKLRSVSREVAELEAGLPVGDRVRILKNRLKEIEKEVENNPELEELLMPVMDVARSAIARAMFHGIG